VDDTAGAAGATDGTRATGGVDRLRTWLANAPAYPPNAGDLRSVAIATLPFAFANLGKPEVETLGTLGGGLLYAWLDWRTGSVLWSGLAHTWILSLAVIGAGVAAGSAGG